MACVDHVHFIDFRERSDMAKIYPEAITYLAEIQLDRVDSAGNATVTMHAEIARPMALCRRNGDMWYSFVLNDTSIDPILPGQATTCLVSFVNSEEAREAFPMTASILFGDGAVTKGTLRILSFDP